MKTKRTPRRTKKKRMPIKHKKWQVQEAKARFSELLNETISSGYQTITKNGQTVAYLVSKDEFDQCLHPNMSILDALDRCPYPEIEWDIERKSDPIRDIDL